MQQNKPDTTKYYLPLHAISFLFAMKLYFKKDTLILTRSPILRSLFINLQFRRGNFMRALSESLIKVQSLHGILT